MSQADSPQNPCGNRHDPEQEYPLAPTDEKNTEEEPVVPPLFPPSAPVERPGEGPFQFSLSEVLGLLVALCLLLGLMRTLPRTWAAFVTGIVVFLSLIAISVLKLERPIVHIGWWAMVVLYVLLCVAAMVSRM